MVLAILGLLQAHRERLPARMSFCFGGILMISLGSALFHTTLTHVAQVLDEVCRRIGLTAHESARIS